MHEWVVSSVSSHKNDECILYFFWFLEKNVSFFFSTKHLIQSLGITENEGERRERSRRERVIENTREKETYKGEGDEREEKRREKKRGEKTKNGENGSDSGIPTNIRMARRGIVRDAICGTK